MNGSNLNVRGERPVNTVLTQVQEKQKPERAGRFSEVIFHK
jgi:hypothetical protein